MMDAMVVGAVERRAQRCAAVTRQELGRGLTGLATIVSVAPLLGLLGSVFGMVDSFRGCGGEKWACLAATVESLAYAMSPTAFGLLLAVLTLSGYRYLSSELATFDIEMANATLDLINRLSSESR